MSADCLGVIQETVLDSWGTIAILSRSFFSLATTSIPFIEARPELGVSSVARILTRVVLPAPFLPIRAKIPEEGAERLTSLRAIDEPPYVLLSLSMTNPSAAMADSGFPPECYFNGEPTALRARALFHKRLMAEEAPALPSLNGIRAGKHALRGASLVVELLILLIVASPILGAVSPQLGPGGELGLGVDLQAVNPQLKFLGSASTIGGAHTLSVPAFNRWFLPARVSLALSLEVNGTTVYQTPAGNVTLAPFQSGTVDLTVNLPQSAISRMEGHTVSGGGEMTLEEAGLWSVTVNLA